MCNGPMKCMAAPRFFANANMVFEHLLSKNNLHCCMGLRFTLTQTGACVSTLYVMDKVSFYIQIKVGVV